ncbi:hypothetical protein GYMLUDRAFT_247097 [Collybiopsis luxurians FD-317 M1]|uniref:Cyclin-like domain-containing protein n=1 Tax=Collybiopsis luxurians FD-317 M1 TaxID=944289 RepID=A0A0D0C4Y6_9AGAR|nr:hypothetical protein GYMLUDRAFT_247097 [Collybiopsis luxurians FD-317 M1]
MATDFWASSHYKRWIVDRITLKESRADDLHYLGDPELLKFFSIYFADIISKLGKKLQLRQRVIATAIVFFRRFYLKNSYCETDPYLVLSACCYVAAKAEESPVHIKNLVSESRAFFSQLPYNLKSFPSDNSKLAEMEFYLVDDLECDLVVFHPYRTLLALVCKKEPNPGAGNGSNSVPDPEEAEAGELGTGIGTEDGPRYWGTGQGKLELSEAALQTAWFIINDTYRSDLCLLYPPHLIAITAIYLTLVLHSSTQSSIAHLLPYSSAFNSTPPADSITPADSPNGSGSQGTSLPRNLRTTRQTSESSKSVSRQHDPIAFLADLNVSLSAISTIAQEMISMYSLWDRYHEDSPEDLRNSPRFPPNPSLLPQQYSQSQILRAFPLPAPPHPGVMPHMLRQYRLQPAHAHAMGSRTSASPLSPAKRSSTGALISRTGGGSASGSGTGSGGSGSGTPDSHHGGGGSSLMEDLFGDGSSGSPVSQLSGHAATPGPASGSSNLLSGGGAPTPAAPTANAPSVNPWPFGQGPPITPMVLALLLNQMREARLNDLAHPPSGRPVVVNRMLERTGGSG